MAWRAGEPLVIEEIEVSPPQPLEIRIKVVCTSLCRSDLSAWESQVSCLFHYNKPPYEFGFIRVSDALYLSFYSLFCPVSLAMKLQGKATYVLFKKTMAI